MACRDWVILVGAMPTALRWHDSNYQGPEDMPTQSRGHGTRKELLRHAPVRPPTPMQILRLSIVPRNDDVLPVPNLESVRPGLGHRPLLPTLADVEFPF